MLLYCTLDSWVESHSALNIGTLRHALGHEFEPHWWQTLFWTQAQHLCFLHDSIWFIWFDTIICLSNLSCELWNRKLKINKIYFKKLFMNNRINSVKYNSIAIFNPKTTHILILYISSHLFGVKLNCWLNMQKSNNASKSFSSYFS